MLALPFHPKLATVLIFHKWFHTFVSLWKLFLSHFTSHFWDLSLMINVPLVHYLNLCPGFHCMSIFLFPVGRCLAFHFFFLWRTKIPSGYFCSRLLVDLGWSRRVLQCERLSRECALPCKEPQPSAGQMLCNGGPLRRVLAFDFLLAPTLHIIRLLKLCKCVRYKSGFYCFNLHFSNYQWGWAFFMSTGHLPFFCKFF